MSSNIQSASAPTLYLMVGYPGSGKTTTAKIIHELTGAEHIWADHERKKMFGMPTHSREESDKLYDALNLRAENLLAEGKSVVFDTNFNYMKDREHMRTIAARQHATTRLLWVITPKDIALHRATLQSAGKETRLFGNMAEEVFERMTHQLEPPADNENPLVLDGTQITSEYIKQKLGL